MSHSGASTSSIANICHHETETAI